MRHIGILSPFLCLYGKKGDRMGFIFIYHNLYVTHYLVGNQGGKKVSFAFGTGSAEVCRLIYILPQ